MLISHTQIELYKQCERRWYYRYVEKIREETTYSALFFGSAIGACWQMMVLPKKENLTEEEKTIINSDPFEFFKKEMSSIEIKKETYDCSDSEHVRYYKSDCDTRLLDERDWEDIEEYQKKNGLMPFGDIEEAYSTYKEERFDTPTLKFFNYICWLCLIKKGKYLIEEYQDKILPKIKKVHAIEKPIKIENGDGDQIIGYIDMICDYEIDGEVNTIIIDHKTSSKKYPTKMINESQQLSLYNYVEEITLIGYLIGVKAIKIPKIGKRKGETHAEIQELFGLSVIEREEEFIVAADNIISEMKSKENEEEFVCNKNECYAFGKKCIHFKRCRS